MSLMQMSMAAGILILGIVLFRSLVVHRMPKKVMMILWEIVILRLLFPFSIALPLPEPFANIRSMVIDREAYEVRTGSFDEEWAEINSPENEGAIAEKDWKSAIAIIYLTGAAVMAAGSLFLYMKDCQLFREGLPMPIQEKDRLIALAAMGEKDRKWFRKIKFQISDRTLTPVTYGILHPAVVFPKGTCFKEEKEAVFCLRHELVHIKNYDNLRKLSAHIALCIHWFNPLVWVMYRFFNRDLELLCDEKVIAGSGGSRQEYALALLSLAECRSMGFQTGLGFGKDAVKERIVAIMTFKKTTLAGLLAAIIAVTSALTVFITNSVKNSEATSVAAGEYIQVQDSETEMTVYAWEGSAERVSAVTIPAVTVAEDIVSSDEMSSGAVESEGLPEGMKEAVAGLVNEFKQYGLSGVVTTDDYQLYFEGEPVYFFADNKKEMEDGFSGRIFLRPADEKNGYTGVITKYEDGKIAGLKHLSAEKSKEYTDFLF